MPCRSTHQALETTGREPDLPLWQVLQCLGVSSPLIFLGAEFTLLR